MKYKPRILKELYFFLHKIFLKNETFMVSSTKEEKNLIATKKHKRHREDQVSEFRVSGLLTRALCAGHVGDEISGG
jgi:hypothetical protein